MLRLYEILKTSKTGIAPDMWTALTGMNWSGADSGHEVKELTGIPPLSFRANGTPLLDYLISGNMTQAGTPTPETPIAPSECGDRTENLFDSSTIEVGGLSPTTGAEITDNTRLRSGFISVEPSTNYGLSREITSSGSFFWVIAYDENKNIVTDATVSAQFSGVLVAGRSLTINRWTFTTTPTTKYIRWYVTADNSYKNIMLNLGSTPLPYEPYGYKIPINSRGKNLLPTLSNIYLGNAQTTRYVKKLVLSSSWNWKLQSINSHGIANFYITITNDFLIKSSVISNYFTLQTTTIADTTTEGMLIALTTDTATVYIRIKSQTASTAQEFKDWLDSLSEEAAIWHVLATPETGIVNEPLRKIGDYADTVSMEQAGVQIPTNRGNTVIDVGTTLKPSEVYIKYKG